MSRRIQELNNKINSAIYGVDVRSALIESFEVIDKRIKWLIVISASQGVAIVALVMELFLS